MIAPPQFTVFRVHSADRVEQVVSEPSDAVDDRESFLRGEAQNRRAGTAHATGADIGNPR